MNIVIVKDIILNLIDHLASKKDTQQNLTFLNDVSECKELCLKKFIIILNHFISLRLVDFGVLFS